MRGDLLAMGAVAALAVAGAVRRGSRNQKTNAQTQTLRVLLQRDRGPYQRWLSEYLEIDPGLLADATDFELDYFTDYLSDERDLSVREDGLLEGGDLNQVDRQLVDGLHFALYHGTSTVLLPSIEVQGLRPARAPQQRSDKAHSTMAGVYLLSDWSNAGWYGGIAARQHGGDPVVLTVQRVLGDLEPDPDDAHLGWKTSAMQFITSYVPPSDIVEWS